MKKKANLRTSEERRVSGEEGIRGPILSGGTPSLMMMTLFCLSFQALQYTCGFLFFLRAGGRCQGWAWTRGKGKGKKEKEEEKRGSEGRKKDGQAHGEITRRRRWRVGREKKRRLWVCLCWDWTECKMDWSRAVGHLGCWAGFGLLLAFCLVPRLTPLCPSAEHSKRLKDQFGRIGLANLMIFLSLAVCLFVYWGKTRRGEEN